MPRFLAREALGASPGREPPKADLTRRAILTSDTGLATTLSGGRVAVAASGTHGVTAANIGPVFTKSFSLARFLFLPAAQRLGLVKLFVGFLLGVTFF